MKHIGFTILCVGVGLAAAFGARNTDDIQNRSKTTMMLSAQADGGNTEAAAKLEEMAAPPSPGQRLADWFSLAGPGFLAGISLIIIGGLTTRKAIKQELENSGSSDGDKPLDFGEAIAQLTSQASAMAAEMQPDVEQWPEDQRYEEVKSKLEDIQLEGLEPLLQTGPRMQALYGMAGFAAVFGPLSGAERMMNRTWSALVDRHWTEATKSITSAAKNLEAAHAEILRLSKENAA